MITAIHDDLNQQNSDITAAELTGKFLIHRRHLELCGVLMVLGPAQNSRKIALGTFVTAVLTADGTVAQSPPAGHSVPDKCGPNGVSEWLFDNFIYAADSAEEAFAFCQLLRAHKQEIESLKQRHIAEIASMVKIRSVASV